MSTKPSGAYLDRFTCIANNLSAFNRRYVSYGTRITKELGYTELPIDIFIRNPESSSHKMAGI